LVVSSVALSVGGWVAPLAGGKVVLWVVPWVDVMVAVSVAVWVDA